MGYYTDYEIMPDVASVYEKEHQAIQDFIEATKIDGWSYLSCVWRGEGTQLTWYEHRKDMAKLSAAFPDVLFILWGHGEEIDDQWKEYYLYGKCQVAQGEIVYDEFDKEKLKDVDLSTRCPSCYGAGVLHADGYSSIGCLKCWGTGEIE